MLASLPAALKLLILLLLPILGLAIRKKWRLAAAEREEIKRLVALAAEEVAEVEIEAAREYKTCLSPSLSSPLPSSSSSSSSLSVGLKGKAFCAVCCKPTSRRCSQCKSVRYCSGKCQIVHWRQGHKEECRPPAVISKPKEYENPSDPRENVNSSICEDRLSKENDSLIHDFDDNAVLFDSSCSSIHDFVEDQTLATSSSDSSSVSTSSSCSTFTISSDTTDDASFDGSPLSQRNTPVVDEACSAKIKISEPRRSSCDDTVNIFLADCPSVKDKSQSKKSELFIDPILAEISAVDKFANWKPTKRVSPLSSDLKQLPIVGSVRSDQDSLKSRSSSSQEFIVRNNTDFQPRPREVGLASFGSSSSRFFHDPRVRKIKFGVSNSISKVGVQFKPSDISRTDNCAEHISQTRSLHEIFVKLCNDKVDIRPFGLTNCGNSCYANVVLQCLTFTRPLHSYLLQGFHSLSCLRSRWCFTCELESLVLRAKQGDSVLSPASIMSRVDDIGAHLGQGREEDAHEFLRSAVDTMYSASRKAKNDDAANRSVPETALMQLIFGGYIRSKIKCMNCEGKSARNERIMDLTIGIAGDIYTLEEALFRFTATEILDGENRYKCSRCKSYQKAKKRLKVLEAPNILTIALKRFQSGKYGKLNKQIAFPEKLNLAEYMSSSSRKSDKCPIYELYAVVVHLDFMNAAFSGHYVCYVRSTAGNWYKIDDSTVKPVKAEKVLSKTAYMLFYERQSPRTLASMQPHNESPSTGTHRKRVDDDGGSESCDSCCSVFSSSPSCSRTASTVSFSSSPTTVLDDSDDDPTQNLTYGGRRCSSSDAAILNSNPTIGLNKLTLHHRTA